MSTQNAGLNAFEEKVNAELKDAKSRIDSIEKSAKGKLAQTAIDAINSFKTKRQEIDKKRQDLKASAGLKAEQLKAELAAEVAKFKGSLEQYSAKLKNQLAAK
jgi:F0F1-type ATP synthase membrane subunit b/b'